MKKLLVFIFILGISLFIVLTTYDFFTSVVPGWHTTIYPLWAIVTTIVLAVILAILIVKMLKLFFKKCNINK